MTILMKAYELLTTMVKIFCCKQLQEIQSSNCKSIASKLLATCVKGLSYYSSSNVRCTIYLGALDPEIRQGDTAFS